ncbi:MAG TPA: hypothetical protein VFA56_12140 [Gaiellaceae bacterium]|nr:hypothetical protein [Gaiellaceae bacterium]
MGESERQRRARIAANESLYRTVNEKLEELNRTLTSVAGDDSMIVVCECGDASCDKQIELSVETYESVRSDSTLFVVVPGHEIPDVETVVRREDRFNVVCKDTEPDETIVKQTDPRR